jgi:hypothetical protein
MFKDLESLFTSKKYEALLDAVEDYWRDDDSTMESRLKLLNSETLKFNISANDKIYSIRQFISSNMFIYIPMSNELLKEENYPHANFSYSRKDPRHIVYWNIIGAIRKYIMCLSEYVETKKPKPDGNAAANAVKFIKENYNTMSSELRDELEEFITQKMSNTRTNQPDNQKNNKNNASVGKSLRDNI